MTKVSKKSQTKQSCKTGVSCSTFSINELHALHSGLIAAKPRLNERTEGYKTTLTLIKKLSDMIAVYYR